MPQLLREWNNGMYAYALANYHFCWCYETECDLPDDCTVKDWDWSTVKYTPENQEEYNRLVEMCACPYHILMAEFDRMETDRPDFTDAVEGPLYDETWHYALDRYFTGWKAVFEACPPTRYHQRDERTAWLTSYSQSWSPFWGPYGLGDFQRKHGLEPYAA
jgi:hypothetical protein